MYPQETRRFCLINSHYTHNVILYGIYMKIMELYYIYIYYTHAFLDTLCCDFNSRESWMRSKLQALRISLNWPSISPNIYGTLHGYRSKPWYPNSTQSQSWLMDVCSPKYGIGFDPSPHVFPPSHGCDNGCPIEPWTIPYHIAWYWLVNRYT